MKKNSKSRKDRKHFLTNLCKTQEKQLEVVDGGLVSDVSVSGGLEQVGVVLGQAGREVGFGDLRSPQRQEAVAPSIGVLKHGRLPSVK